MLLKQLVDQRIPSGVHEWLQSLRSWRRWLMRVGELGIQAPDPVLLMSTLDRYAATLAKGDAHAAFRVQVARASLRVDTAPTVQGVYQFAEVLMAEGEALYHGSGHLGSAATAKIKAVTAEGELNVGGAKGAGRDSREWTGKGQDPRDRGGDGKGDGKMEFKPEAEGLWEGWRKGRIWPGW